MSHPTTSDLTALTTQDLRDIEKAARLAVRQINIMSETAGRFISLENRVIAERRRRGAR